MQSLSEHLLCVSNTREVEALASEREGVKLLCFGGNFGFSHLHKVILSAEDCKEGLEMWLW